MKDLRLLPALGILVSGQLLAMPPMTGPDGLPVGRIRWPGAVESPEPVKAPSDQPRRILVLLADFTDNQSRHGGSEFSELLFGTGNRSMADYYREASYGALTLEGAVEGWYRMDETYTFFLGDSYGVYGDYPRNSQGLVAELVEKADPDVDFSRFDGDGDGVVDGLLVVHAGPGAEETGETGHIWSHKWQLSDTRFGSPGPIQTGDGVLVDPFSVQPERFKDGSIVTIGVFCHEFGHMLGLPDLYDTDYSSSGIGSFCLMAAGSWGRASESSQPGSSPVHLCAWCKYFLGWIRPDSVEAGLADSLPDVQLAAVASEPCCYRLLANPMGMDWTGSVTGQGEYFLVENRQQTGFDAGLPGSGLLILHVDESRSGNDDEQRPLVGLLQADRSPAYALPANDRGADSDLWKSSDTGVASFTVPSTAYYDGVQSGAAIRGISASGSVMSADLEVAPLFLGKVYSFPNPVVVRDNSARATIVYEPTDIEKLAGRFPKFTVRVFNLAAEPVRLLDEVPYEVNLEHRAAYWDLKNDNHRPVTSGAYFYVVEVNDADVFEQSRGRLAIVR